LPAREILTGIGQINGQVPRVRDRQAGDEQATDRPIFSSQWIPKYLRRSGEVNDLLPLLYLKGLSTGDFAEALEPIVGAQAKSLNPSVISRLKGDWKHDYPAWQARDLSGKSYAYWWADGIHLAARSTDEKQCALVIIGVKEDGEKALVAMELGLRESQANWLELLQDLRSHGVESAPLLAVGDGALGFWAALNAMFPGTRHQRCWFHKTSNIVNKLPKSYKNKALKDIQAIWMAPTKGEAKKAIKAFCNKYRAAYPKASECLKKDQDELLAFYDFPAEHWSHLRTTHPIESVFSVVRHRTKKSRNCHSHDTLLTMIYKLMESAKKRWHKIRGAHLVSDVLSGVKFKDGQRVAPDQPSTISEHKHDNLTSESLECAA